MIIALDIDLNFFLEYSEDILKENVLYLHGIFTHL